ncbi:hypothetical protein PK28_17105 (plasmid) [Hymenobacter sp. DG25B]|uniref:hypothetical protein n=1 Tax=Hymenobacter sp. DG25B TaxID=1385664 RepID=UPI000540ABCD|nr:hypothetical protein [Hymenobacter sp. DG25B]AIZ65391.1 hypothetical protein PK28_17105 [Hymenobacter sp. DG25B]
MFKNFFFTGCCLVLTASCSEGDGANGVYQEVPLVSSAGDTLYVKSYNWGLTGDHQLSTISDTNVPIGWDDQQRQDIVKGLDPFLYRFAHDTLTVYTRAPLPDFNIRCPSIVVRYQLVDNPQYMSLYEQVGKQSYYRVPR